MNIGCAGLVESNHSTIIYVHFAWKNKKNKDKSEEKNAESTEKFSFFFQTVSLNWIRNIKSDQNHPT